MEVRKCTECHNWKGVALTAVVLDDFRLSFDVTAEVADRCDVMFGGPAALFFFVVTGAESKMKSSSHWIKGKKIS